MSTFKLDANNRFIINDYQLQRPFSSILPGIAGPMGIPVWVFYVNRGQAITSFGVESKDHPLMEFQPANKAYQATPFVGFRTFIKIINTDKHILYEPFMAGSRDREQRMIISLNELELYERYAAQGLQVEILYFILPEEKVAGLVRRVRITNLASDATQLEILDGLPVIIPYGVANNDLKERNRTVEAWMQVCNLEQNVPFFHLSATLGDTVEVKPVKAGNFAFAYAAQGDSKQQLSPIVNPEVVFGQNTSLTYPIQFEGHSLAEMVQQPQITRGRTPCAFFGYPATLAPAETISLYSLYGYASKIEVLNEVAPRLGGEGYFSGKRNFAIKLVSEITAPIETITSMPVFDSYCRQTFLDNVLRGGWPVQLGTDDTPITYHIYSRKHGDPERDYNVFFLAAEYYSQGNGNYRDVNQNRRCEVMFTPHVEDTNIRSFMSLIQLDGYNPLVVKGSWFWIPPERRITILKLTAQPERMELFLEKPFTPGSLLRWLDENEVTLNVSTSVFLNETLQQAEQHFDAEYGHGYWIDHWTYNLDLINCYLAVYPDRGRELLFGKADLPFFESPVYVQPRSKKYVLVSDHPRQYGAVVWDDEKFALISARREYPNWMRTQKGEGSVYRTTLYAKLVILALIKFATLDPLGLGVEMEADRPGWCDALNGLPGMFGSSLSETFELVRLFNFLSEHLPADLSDSLHLPREVVDLLRDVVESLRAYHNSNKEERDYSFWDGVSNARELYRERVRFGIEGEVVPIPFQELAGYFSLFLEKLLNGIERAVELNGGFPPTYFTYNVEQYEISRGEDGKPLEDNKGRSHIKALRFRPRVLPIFLEGPMRMFKTLSGVRAARQLHQQVKHSALYDRSLHMYKTNVSLENEPVEIGRLRAFTPGWLENESIFLHMEYKYLLELLRAGLYEEFFQDFRHSLVAFQDPARYGRSPLENSSFIVSSVHPDKNLHGTGFVSRLTGATAEFLNMWIIMMAGQNPFFVDSGELCLRLQPALPGWLFDDTGMLSFTFLGKCQITYHNPLHKNTYADGIQIQRLLLHLEDKRVELKGNVIRSPYAAFVREGRIDRIEAFFLET